MSFNIKIFLFCPIPEGQKPINEYINYKQNFLTTLINSTKKENTFSCIIYTQHPEVLQANNILLQSIQPTLSVPWLTLAQINKFLNPHKISDKWDKFKN
jgi:hypothetical protein